MTLTPILIRVCLCETYINNNISLYIYISKNTNVLCTSARDKLQSWHYALTSSTACTQEDMEQCEIYYCTRIPSVFYFARLGLFNVRFLFRQAWFVLCPFPHLPGAYWCHESIHTSKQFWFSYSCPYCWNHSFCLQCSLSLDFIVSFMFACLSHLSGKHCRCCLHPAWLSLSIS